MSASGCIVRSSFWPKHQLWREVGVLGLALVRNTSWYPIFNGSHFGLPPTWIHRMTTLPPKLVWTMTYSHRPHYFAKCTWCAWQQMLLWGMCALRHGTPDSIEAFFDNLGASTEHWKKLQDKGLRAPCREKPLEKSGLEPAAPNRLADRKHCALSTHSNPHLQK